jgi:hypothetical protein
MSVKENIQFFPQFDTDSYLKILKDECGAIEHPTQADCYLIDGLPFYKPRKVEDHVSVLGFNYAPLPDLLIQALNSHPELVPDEVLVLWTIEQELFLETTMGNVRSNHS